MSKPTPAHLLPDACHVCGGEEHPNTSGHNYWSNAEARASESREARRHNDADAALVNGATLAAEAGLPLGAHVPTDLARDDGLEDCSDSCGDRAAQAWHERTFAARGL